MTVAPVVVRPETVSNMESVKLIPKLISGMVAIRGSAIQMTTVRRKASLAPVEGGAPPDRTARPVPIRMLTAAETRKMGHWSDWSAISRSADGIMAAPRRATMIPIANMMARSCIPLWP